MYKGLCTDIFMCNTLKHKLHHIMLTIYIASQLQLVYALYTAQHWISTSINLIALYWEFLT